MRWDRKKLPKPDAHVYGENGAEIMVYNMKRNPKKKRGGKKNREKEKSKKYNSKRKNSRLLIILFRLSWGWFLYFASIILLPKHSQPIHFFKIQANFFSHTLQIYCLGLLGLSPILFWSLSQNWSLQKPMNWVYSFSLKYFYKNKEK